MRPSITDAFQPSADASGITPRVVVDQVIGKSIA
jgi:hypothetical protein